MSISDQMAWELEHGASPAQVERLMREIYKLDSDIAILKTKCDDAIELLREWDRIETEVNFGNADYTDWEILVSRRDNFLATLHDTMGATKILTMLLKTEPEAMRAIVEKWKLSSEKSTARSSNPSQPDQRPEWMNRFSDMVAGLCDMKESES